MARTPEDDLDEARKLKRRARSVHTTTVRRRLQRAAERLEVRAAQKIESRLRKRVGVKSKASKASKALI